MMTTLPVTEQTHREVSPTSQRHAAKALISKAHYKGLPILGSSDESDHSSYFYEIP